MWYTAVYIYNIYHTPWSGFQARLLYNQEGANSANSANTERYVFGKLSARFFQRCPFWHRPYSNCGDFEHGKSAKGGVIYTVVYGIARVYCRAKVSKIFDEYTYQPREATPSTEIQ